MMIKYALITASTKGIGKAIGISLLEQGYFVFFNYAHSSEDAALLASELKNYANHMMIIQADMSCQDGIRHMTSTVIAHSPKLDVLIHNAAFICKTPFQELSYEDWQRSMDTNLNLPFFLTQQLSNHLEEQASIIFIGAVMGQVPHAISIPYSVSKAGLTMLAKSLVKVFKTRKITVNVVAPGFIETPYQQSKDPDHRRRIENKIALQRFGYPEEISSTCLHLIGNKYINGAVITVDGGYDME